LRSRHHAGCRVAVERAADRYTLICDGPVIVPWRPPWPAWVGHVSGWPLLLAMYLAWAVVYLGIALVANAVWPLLLLQDRAAQLPPSQATARSMPSGRRGSSANSSAASVHQQPTLEDHSASWTTRLQPGRLAEGRTTAGSPNQRVPSGPPVEIDAFWRQCPRPPVGPQGTPAGP
jgi:hypothetical protein